MTKKELKAYFKRHEEDPRQPDSPRSYASAQSIACARETWRDEVED